MKKDEARFTIRFNPVDPRHHRAMEVLEKAGRRKASLIADAVCEYLARHGENGATEIFTVAPLLAITPASTPIQTKESLDNIPPSQVPESVTGIGSGVETTTNGFSEDVVLDSELHEAVLSGLSSFNL